MLIVECKSSTYKDHENYLCRIGKFTAGKTYDCFHTDEGYLFFHDDEGIHKMPKLLNELQFSQMFKKLKMIK